MVRRHVLATGHLLRAAEGSSLIVTFKSACVQHLVQDNARIAAVGLGILASYLTDIYHCWILCVVRPSACSSITVVTEASHFRTLDDKSSL